MSLTPRRDIARMHESTCEIRLQLWKSWEPLDSEGWTSTRVRVLGAARFSSFSPFLHTLSLSFPLLDPYYQPLWNTATLPAHPTIFYYKKKISSWTRHTCKNIVTDCLHLHIHSLGYLCAHAPVTTVQQTQEVVVFKESFAEERREREKKKKVINADQATTHLEFSTLWFSLSFQLMPGRRNHDWNSFDERSIKCNRCENVNIEITARTAGLVMGGGGREKWPVETLLRAKRFVTRSFLHAPPLSRVTTLLT